MGEKHMELFQPWFHFVVQTDFATIHSSRRTFHVHSFQASESF